MTFENEQHDYGRQVYALLVGCSLDRQRLVEALLTLGDAMSYQELQDCTKALTGDMQQSEPFQGFQSGLTAADFASSVLGFSSVEQATAQVH